MALSYGVGVRRAQSKTGSTAGRHVLYYVDPMHPAYKSDHPGIAPDCGMRLEPVYAGDAADVPASLTPLPAGAVRIDRPMQQLLGIRLAPVEKSGGTHIVRVVARVVPEDTRIYRINSGVDGFIRETYSDSVGMRVKKNQKLATYYAPEFLSTASGFLAAVQGVPGAVGKDGARTVPFPGTLAKQGVSSLQGYSDRLRNLGMSDVQIQEMADSHQLPQSIDVVAPADGFILARNISPGQHFEHDMEFYRIADLSRVWVVADVYEQEARLLRPGGLAQVSLREGGRKLRARITDSLPQAEAGSQTLKLRLEVDNPGFILRPEMLVDVDLPVTVPPGITVPLDALVNSGARKLVYVEHGQGIFEPREVETGWSFGDRAEIVRGVTPGEQVVTGATFLVDSESRLTTAAAVKAPAPPPDRLPASTEAVASAKKVTDPSCGMQIDKARAIASGNTVAYRGATYYFCSADCRKKFQNDPDGLAGTGHGAGRD
jgi:Cu(I)/Ag(I) efflux system membrane fusion protein